MVVVAHVRSGIVPCPSCPCRSVGCTVLQMATGAPPWKALKFESANALMYHIASCGTPPPLPSTISAELKELLLACFRQVRRAPSLFVDPAGTCDHVNAATTTPVAPSLPSLPLQQSMHRVRIAFAHAPQLALCCHPFCLRTLERGPVPWNCRPSPLLRPLPRSPAGDPPIMVAAPRAGPTRSTLEV